MQASNRLRELARRLRVDRLFRAGMISTLIGLAACVATHVVTLLGLAGALAWLGAVEHGLVVFTLGAAGVTLWAARRHRRGDCAR